MANFENTLFPAIEAALKATTIPLDGAQLFEYPEIKAHVKSANRVSDYLGKLWRKGLVSRLPPADDSHGRSLWRYQWRGELATPTTSATEHTPKAIAGQPTMTIKELEGVVTMEVSNLIISIRQKPLTFSYLEGLKNG